MTTLATASRHTRDARAGVLRAACGLLVPALDALAIGGPIALARPEAGPGLATAGLAFVGLLLHWRARRHRLRPSAAADVVPIVSTMAVAAVVVGGVVPEQDLARLARATLVAAGLVVAGRSVSYAVLRALRSRGLLAEPTILVGEGTVAAALAETLERRPEHGLRPVAVVGAEGTSLADLPLEGPVDALPEAVRRTGATRVVVAFTRRRDEELVAVLRRLDGVPVEVFVVPRLFELGTAPDTTQEVWGLPIVHVRRPALRGVAWRAKRAVDVVVAGVGLLLLSPLLAAAALAVRASGPGPILFRQKRIGQDGRPIEILKFRTLEVNEDSDTTWSVENDGRLTRAGRILRETHLDELPQLLSVLRGEMSLVGPRPERPFFVDLFSASIPRYADRHRVPVGLTGWAQVHGLNGDTSIEERARFDNRYIETWSLGRDLVILLRTAGAVLRGLAGGRPGEAGRRTAPQATTIDLRDKEVELDLRPADELRGNGQRPHRDGRPDPTPRR
jgi:exopolysaccharide biosynthesis polyprenyl glycosylphosphotransferase